MKKKFTVLLTFLLIAMTNLCVYATEGESTASEAMSTAMEGVKNDALSAIATVAPYGIAIMGTFLVWKYGIKFFKSISK